MSDPIQDTAEHDWEHEEKILDPPKFAFSGLSAASAEFVPSFLKAQPVEPKPIQAEPEQVATQLEESLNLKEEEKPAPATTVEEEGKENVSAESSEPEAATVVEDSHAAAPEEDAATPEEDAGDSRQHLNVVFIGHVDAGKSTIGGQILYLSNMVDERTIQKYEREAKEKNRESWYMAYIMDTNEEERAKGKTVEVGRAHFETDKTRFTILDAPGHKNYVPNMISGASQADVGVLVISARKGEFETGFERGGQTREHAQLAKTLGVSKLLVVVNKMDDPSVEWGKDRFDEIEKKIVPFFEVMRLQHKERCAVSTYFWAFWAQYEGTDASECLYMVGRTLPL